jgi:PAS domain S-box-containing protein
MKARSTNPDFEDFFRLCADVLCIVGCDGTLQRVNVSWKSTLGFAADAVPGKPLSAFVHPDDWPSVAERLAKLARRRRPALFECRCRTRNGEWRWLEWNVVTVTGRKAFFASARDVTDRKRAEAEIEKLAAFPRMNPNAVFEFARDGQLTYFNAAAGELTRALGQARPSAILPPNTSEIVRDCFTRGESLLRVETTFREQVLSWSFHTVPGIGVVHCYATDITEHKRAEYRIREQAELLDKAQDAIIVRDLEHRILYWNKGAERVFGWPAGGALGQNAFELLSKNQGAPCLEALRAVVETGEWSGELVHATRSGGEAIVASRWTLVRDSEGRPKSILALSTDITEKKRLESQFLRSQRLESIGALASGVAHDFNNILAPIVMSVNLLRESLSDPDDHRLIETLQQCAQRGAEMVRQILAFTRGGQGGRAAISPSNLVSEWATIARETFPRSIQIETDTGRGIWPVHADATQLYQLLMNLCVNARDAMPVGGTLTIALRNVELDEKHRPLHPDARPGRYVLLTVVDTGTGIEPEHIEQLWNPRAAAKSPGESTGLGLSSVLSIVRGHSGFAHAESRPGQGSCFEVYLPASTTPEPETDPQPAAPVSSGCGQTILLIDDERAIQEITGAIFAEHGYRVVTAGDGTEALALFAQQKDTIDLVVTDMIMPCLDGPATIRGLQRLKPGLPVIATSGLAENEALARELDHTKFLLKPFTTERLLHAVSESLRAA